MDRGSLYGLMIRRRGFTHIFLDIKSGGIGVGELKCRRGNGGEL
jgi:hypothetical protein